MDLGKYWDKAWSLVEGCTPVSEACDHCWLQSVYRRFYGGEINRIILRSDRMELPLKIKKPTVFAVWSDLFHEKVPADFITEAFGIMAHCPQHTFLVLTKRPERIASVLYGEEGFFYLGGGDHLPNIWLGTTVENEAQVRRVFHLVKAPYFKKFISVEPMLGQIHMASWLEHCYCGYFITEHGDPHVPCKKYSPAINAVICGCESGPGARETKEVWVRDLSHQCEIANVPFFLKQLKLNNKIFKAPIVDGVKSAFLPWRQL